ncbi:hypothetical protein CBF23_002120 [Marinomonas agarivorans]|nr:hypothetical protein CBF23_002120 [Marinomonas agarivorans]
MIGIEPSRFSLLIHRDQANQADIEAIRAALIEDEQSGEAQPKSRNKRRNKLPFRLYFQP